MTGFKDREYMRDLGFRIRHSLEELGKAMNEFVRAVEQARRQGRLDRARDRTLMDAEYQAWKEKLEEQAK